MNVPSSLDQLVLFVLFVLPGITFSTIRVSLSGWKAPDYGVGARVLEALFVSAIFDAVYLLFLAEALVEQAKRATDVLSLVSTMNVFLSLVLLIGFPALVAIVAYLRPKLEGYHNKWGKKRFRFRLANSYRSTPQAWDHKVLKAGGEFVRVRLESGIYYGGWYAGQSLASTYPHSRDLFIQSQWKLNANGDFLGRIKGTRGLWIPITDKTIVEWIDPPEQAKGEGND